MRRPWAALHLAAAMLGFTLVAVAQLTAFTRMGELAARLGGGRGTLVTVFAGAFLVLTGVSLARQAVLMTFAYLDATRRAPDGRRWPSVSILVPAHDEAARIERALEAIAALDYPDVETLVVDDGSRDDTAARARRFAASHPRVRVLSKPNGGKWSALNLGFQRSRGEFVVCVDADSHLAPDCLRRLARHFDDERVGGCAGQVAVRNQDGLLARLQSLEYVLMNGLLRRMQSYFGMVLVAPGPVSMFRRAVLDEVLRRWGAGPCQGPWEKDTFAEDADLSLTMLLTGRRLVYEASAISYTTVPSSTFTLLNQRYRWTRGNLQAAVKAWRRWQGAPDAPREFPFWIGALLFETVLWPVVNIVGLLGFAVFVALFGVGGPILAWFIGLTLLDLNAAALSVRLERASLRHVLLAPLNRLYFSVLLDVSKFFALWDELRNRRMSWS